MEEAEILQKLDFLLEEAVKSSLKDVGSAPVGVVFSGGVDSALVAKVVLDLGYCPILFSAGLEGFFKDEPFVELFAKKFRLQTVVIRITKEEVINLVRPVSQVLREVGIDYSQSVFSPAMGWQNQPLQISLGIPFYLVAKASQNLVSSGALVGDDRAPSVEKIQHFLCAQGGDELFGGGHKHLQLPLEELNGQLARDFDRLMRVDYIRDTAMFSNFGSTLHYPLAQQSWVRFVQNMDPEWKIRHDLGEVGRKYLWRQLALKRGVPEENALRKKHAMQYSSGFWKVVRKCMVS